MHTIGHTGMHTGSHTAVATAVSTLPHAIADACPDGHCEGGPGPGWSVCVAVTGGLALAVLLLMVVSVLLRGRSPRHDGGAASCGPRGPPQRIAATAALSMTVLRI